jgi:hypothetical protein
MLCRRLGSLDVAPAGQPALARVRGRANSHRVLRGGSFNNNERNVRCAVRNRNNPNNWNRNNGFRCVVAHDFLSVCMPELPGGSVKASGPRLEVHA